MNCSCDRMGAAVVKGKALWIRAPKALIEPLAKSDGYLPLVELDRTGNVPAYIVKALQGYKSGERSHPSMRAVAATLSDKDMADLAAYYANTDNKTASK